MFQRFAILLIVLVLSPAGQGIPNPEGRVAIGPIMSPEGLAAIGPIMSPEGLAAIGPIMSPEGLAAIVPEAAIA